MKSLTKNRDENQAISVLFLFQTTFVFVEAVVNKDNIVPLRIINGVCV